MRKTMKCIAVVLFLFNVVFCLRAQNLDLTKAQMYEDFDSLVSMVGYYNPHLEVYKKTMGFDVLENIKQMRPKIEDIDDISAYFMLINRCLNLIPEAHSRMLSLDEEMIMEYADTTQLIPAVIKQEDIPHMIGLYKEVLKGWADYYSHNYPIYLTVEYLDGNYCFTRPCDIINQKDSFSCNTGDLVTQINGIPIHTFIAENHKSYYDRLRWDAYNHRFYTKCFLWVDGFPQTSFPVTNITVGKSDGREEIVSLNRDTHFYIHSDDFLNIFEGDSIKEDKKAHIKSYDRKPVIWLQDSLLYIKIPSMNPGDMELYTQRIRQLCGHKSVGNVILDVRHNGGGSDKVCEKILGLLTNVPLFRKQLLCVNTPEICEDYILGDRPVNLLNDSLLGRQVMVVDHNSRMIAEPSEKSIGCEGKIYVLHDEDTYSAANTLVTLALNNDKLVAVGTPMGYLCGYGVDPFVFQLPVSKFLFMMHSVIHIPENAADAEAYLWNKTEIRVVPTVRYINLFEEYRQYDLLYQYDFLKEYDPYFQAVMDDISKK